MKEWNYGRGEGVGREDPMTKESDGNSSRLDSVHKSGGAIKKVALFDACPNGDSRILANGAASWFIGKLM